MFIIWGAALAYSILIIALLEFEKPFWCFVSTAAVVLGLVFLGPGLTSVVAWASAHPVQLFGAVVSWFVAGTAWAVAKWFFHCAGIKRRIVRAQAEWLAKNSEIPKLGTSAFASYSNIVNKHLGRFKYEDIPPNVAKNKSRILTWMSWWPWSAVWTVINDPIRRIFTEIYYGIARWLQGMSDAMFKDIPKMKVD